MQATARVASRAVERGSEFLKHLLDQPEETPPPATDAAADATALRRQHVADRVKQTLLAAGISLEPPVALARSAAGGIVMVQPRSDWRRMELALAAAPDLTAEIEALLSPDDASESPTSPRPQLVVGAAETRWLP
jgi:hypothetical protein